jgi:hypothetical protein
VKTKRPPASATAVIVSAGVLSSIVRGYGGASQPSIRAVPSPSESP